MSISGAWLRLRIKLRYWLLSLRDLIVAPLRWNERRVNAKRQHEIALAEIAANANAKVLDALGSAMLGIVKEQSTNQQAITNVLVTWLEGFKVTQAPSTTALSDKDEYDLEMQAAMEKDGLKDANPAQVLKWLDEQSLMNTLDE